MIFQKSEISMNSDETYNEHERMPEQVRKMLENIVLVNRAICELTSGCSLFNIVNLVDGEPFAESIETRGLGKCGIVWYIPSPAENSHCFNCQFCTAIGQKPDLEFGETEDLDTEWISNNARAELIKQIKESSFERRSCPRHTDILLELTQSHLEKTTSRRVPVCVLASYNVSNDDTTTLLAYHPCITPVFALEVWLAIFNF